MKQNTFDPCKKHENGHFPWCLLCEIEQLRKTVQEMEGIISDLNREILGLRVDLEKCMDNDYS